MDPDVAYQITQLAEDHHSGATAIATQAAEVFSLAAETSRAPGEAQFLADLAEVGHVLMAAQPAMAPLFHPEVAEQGLQDLPEIFRLD